MRFFFFISSLSLCSALATITPMDWKLSSNNMHEGIPRVKWEEKYWKIPSIARYFLKSVSFLSLLISPATTRTSLDSEIPMVCSQPGRGMSETLIVCRLCAKVSRAVVFYDNVKAIHSEYFFKLFCVVSSIHKFHLDLLFFFSKLLLFSGLYRREEISWSFQRERKIPRLENFLFKYLWHCRRYHISC